MMPVLQQPAARPRLWTAEELQTLPEDRRVELLRGEILEMPPPPGGPHGNTISVLTILVGSYVVQNRLGATFAAETGFRIGRNPDTVLAPDFAFVREARMPRYLQRGYLDLTPDLVMEAQSPSESGETARLKVDLWLRAGAAAVWLMDPERATITVYRPDGDPVFLERKDTLTAEDLLPGFSLPLETVFARIEPVTGGSD